MKIQIRFVGINRSATLHARALRRVQQHLSRFQKSLRSVIVRVGRGVGPGPLEQRCEVVVDGPGVGTTKLEALGKSLRGVLDGAIEKAEEAVARRLARVHVLERRPVSAWRSA